MNQEGRLASAVAFVLNDGAIVYPIRRTNRETWARTFRIGLSSEAQDDILEIEDEYELIAMLMRKRYAVRCASADGRRRGMFSPDHRHVARFIVAEREPQS